MGVSVMVWGAFYATSGGPLYTIGGLMYKEHYLEIMNNIIIPY